MLKRATVLTILTAVTGFTVMLFAFGHTSPVSDAKDPASPSRGEPVSTMTLRFSDKIEIERSFPGRIEAPRRTDIAFEISGRLADIAVQEGDVVKRGDDIARLDAEATELEIDGLRATVAGLQEQTRLAQRDVQRLERLVARGSAPAKSLEQARAQLISTTTALNEADAALAGADLRLRQTVLVAPADGYVGAILARADETLAAGQTFVSIFQDGPNRLRVPLPPDIDPATLRDPRLDVGGQEIPVTLESVRPDIDPATNSRSAVFALREQAAGSAGQSLLPGQGAKLLSTVTVPMRGAWVPLDALRPNPEGTWMLVGVSQDGLAERIDVEILYLRDSEAYVSGNVADGDRVVAAGIHKVVPGQLLDDRTALQP